MGYFRFLYNNLWDTTTYTISYSSQHSYFPATNTRQRWPTRSWRSNYGSGSGWGRFIITAATNDKINFSETIGVELTATLTPGTYDADTLAAEIKTQLDAAGASTYTVTYSNTTNKFTLVSNGVGGGGVFRLLWQSGTNTATSVGATIGFNVAADDTGALTYTADYLRIHTSEYLSIDLTAATSITGFVIRHHNFSATAVVRIQADSASDFSTSPLPVNVLMTTQDKIMPQLWSSATGPYQYWRLLITDVDNADGFVEVGRIFLGGEFKPAYKDTSAGWEDTPIDPSMITKSEGGQVSSIQYAHGEERTYELPVIGEKSSFDAVFTSRGLSKNLFICDNDATPLTCTYYVKINSWSYKHLSSTDYMLSVTFEELV